MDLTPLIYAIGLCSLISADRGQEEATRGQEGAWRLLLAQMLHLSTIEAVESR
jgi:hypothetical protein